MILYKYLNIEGSKATAENKCVRLRKPSEYNDAFDSVFYLSKRERKKAFRLFTNYFTFKETYKLAISKDFKPNKNVLYWNVLKSDILAQARDIKETKMYKPHLYITTYRMWGNRVLRKNDSEIKKQFDEMLSKVTNQIRESALISCFSTKNDSILMWAHYAQNNQGACFEFDVSSDEYIKVDYSKKKKVFKLTKLLKHYFGHDFCGEEIDTTDKKYLFALQPVLTKSLDWAYEHEYRCAFSTSSSDKRIKPHGEMILLQMDKLKKVYIGCKAKPEFEREIRNLIKDEKIPIVRMVANQEEKYVITPNDNETIPAE